MGYLSFEPATAERLMKEIQSKYDDLFTVSYSVYRLKTTELMMEGWVSPNGKKAVEKTVTELNSVLDRITNRISFSFANLNRACVLAMTTLTKDGKSYDGPTYHSMTFQKSDKKFNSDNAKTNINGKLYIYDDKLNEVIDNLKKYDDFVKRQLESIWTSAKAIPLGDEGDNIKGAIDSTFSTIKKDLSTITEETCNAINTKLSETDADVIQAKKNAKAVMEKTGGAASTASSSKSGGTSSSGTTSTSSSGTTSTSTEDSSSKVEVQTRDIPVTASSNPAAGNYSQRYNGSDMNPNAGTFNVTTGNPTYNMSDAEVAQVAAIVYGEAVEGSPGDAMAVASVMANRIEGGKNWGGTSEGLLGVATAPNQFVAYGGRKYNNFMSSYQSGNMNEGMQICMQAVRDVMNGVRNNNYESFRGNGSYNRYF